MKRICSLFFLCLIVFNTIGYYGLFVLIQQQLTTPILQKIETNLNELGGNLIFVIPMELPYGSSSEEYTGADGEIIYEGDVYRLVRQKFYHNMLYVVCVKDDRSSEIRGTMADYSKLFSGQQAEHTDSNIKIINSLSKYYTLNDHKVCQIAECWYIVFDHSQYSDLYCYSNSTSVFHPPQYS